jgi:hypothetical protein
MFLFVPTPNTFACLAPWRDLICFFSREGAKFAMNFGVCFHPKYLCELCASARVNI